MIVSPRGTTTAASEELRRLRQQNAELRRPHNPQDSVDIFPAAGLDRHLR